MDIEIFDGFGVGEVMPDERASQPCKEARDEVPRMVVGGPEKGYDRRPAGCPSEGESADHISMKEIGNDDVRAITSHESAETEEAREVEEGSAAEHGNRETGRDELRRECAGCFERDEPMLELCQAG